MLLELFITYVKIGFTSFGGLSMVPLINSEMLRHGWMTQEEVLDIVAIAEMTPGPLGINCATFVGTRLAGVLGAAVAVLGVLTPTLTLCLLAAVCFERFKQSRVMQNALYGIRPVCIGMIAATAITLGRQNFFAGSVNWAGIGICIAVALVMLKWRPSIPKVIALAAVLGLIFG